MPLTIIIICAVVMVVLYALRKGYGVKANISLNMESKDKTSK